YELSAMNFHLGETPPRELWEREQTGLASRASTNTTSRSHVLAFAQRNIAQRARRKQLLELHAPIGQSVLVGILQQCLDRGSVRLDAVGKPVRSEDRPFLLEERLKPCRGHLGRAH